MNNDKDRPNTPKGLPSVQSSGEKTPYEKMIEKRRAENKALLEELKLNEIKAGLLIDLQKSKPVRKIMPIKTIEPQRPTRRSKRLQNVAMDLSEKALYEKALREATGGKKTKAEAKSAARPHRSRSRVAKTRAKERLRRKRGT